MRRARAHRLTLDDDGWTECPVVVLDRLFKLARWHGDLRDAVFPFAFEMAHRDVEKLDEQREWRHAYLGRYMHLAIDVAEAMPARVLRHYMKRVSDIVTRENGKPTKDDRRYL